MNYFLILPDNTLDHLPDFQLFRSEQPTQRRDLIGGSSTIPDRKEPDHFSCSCPEGGPPKPFLVTDENAHVYDCAASNANIGPGKFVVAGVILKEYDAPMKNEALKHIQNAMNLLAK